MVQEWSYLYHSIVSAILDGHLEPETEQVTCDQNPHLAASGPLAAIAMHLQPWAPGRPGEDVTATVEPPTESDMPAVLTAYLRAYTCALQERERELFQSVTAEAFDGHDEAFEMDPHEGGDEDLSLTAILDEVGAELLLIKEELRTVGPALARTLQYVTNRDRFSMIGTNMVCLERASLEIRNIMGLNAAVSACLPRAWDARDPLRDI